MIFDVITTSHSNDMPRIVRVLRLRFERDESAYPGGKYAKGNVADLASRIAGAVSAADARYGGSTWHRDVTPEKILALPAPHVGAGEKGPTWADKLAALDHEVNLGGTLRLDLLATFEEQG